MNREFAYLGKVVTESGVLEEGAVVISNDRIKAVGDAKSLELPETIYEMKNSLIGPGFVDIHCHAGGRVWSHENPQDVATHHLKFGTTGILLTLYRDLGLTGMKNALELIKDSMHHQENILGAHLEGPYLNPNYGAGRDTAVSIPARREDYMPLIETGIIRHWTFSPEEEGTLQLLEDLTAHKIAPAIGHSAASPEQVYEAAKNGTRIVTHLTNATGSSVSPSRYPGTIEVSFDHAAMLCDNLFYEIICDSKGIHVRHDLIRLIIKTVGIEKLIGVTDACTGSLDDTDVNMLGETLMGSKLTMLQVARNFKNIGLSPTQVFQITSLNPAKAIGVSDEMGSLAPGKMANLVITDDSFSSVQVVLKGTPCFDHRF